VHDRLGAQQVDFEHSDDEEIADEEEIFEETEGVQSEAQGDVEGDWSSFCRLFHRGRAVDDVMVDLTHFPTKPEQ
jgi:hypothetical protein